MKHEQLEAIQHLTDRIDWHQQERRKLLQQKSDLLARCDHLNPDGSPADIVGPGRVPCCPICGVFLFHKARK